MGFVKRILMIFRSHTSGALDKMDDPIKRLYLSAQDIEDKKREVEDAAIDVRGEYNLTKGAIAKADDAIQTWKGRAEKALSKGRDAESDEDKSKFEGLAREAARHAIEAESKKEHYQRQIEHLEPLLKQLEDKIQELGRLHHESLSKARSLETRLKSAKSLEKVSKTVSGIGQEVQSIDTSSVQDEIDRIESRTQAIAEMEKTTPSSLFKELDELSGQQKVDDLIGELKAKGAA